MQGKVVLVTGANGGLGRYVAQSFLDAGATVVGNSRKIQQSDFSGANFVALPGGALLDHNRTTILGPVGKPAEAEAIYDGLGATDEKLDFASSRGLRAI